MKLEYLITDNDGKTCDRYSLLLKSEASGGVWEAHYCNSVPFWPQGVGMFGGTFETVGPPLTADEHVLAAAEKRLLPPDSRRFFAMAIINERKALQSQTDFL